MYVCTLWKGVPYHLWAKMLHPEDPPHIFWKPKKHVGGVYFMWSGEIFLRNFLPYPPQNIPGLKGGDIMLQAADLHRIANDLGKLHVWQVPGVASGRVLSIRRWPSHQKLALLQRYDVITIIIIISIFNIHNYIHIHIVCMYKNKKCCLFFVSVWERRLKVAALG